MTYRIGIDIGGTFTDFSVFDEDSGQVVLAWKNSSVPHDPVAGVKEGLEVIVRAIKGDGVSYVLHGTTVGVNTLLEETGAMCGLLTTKGFRDVYEIGRQWRGHDVYNLFIDGPKMLMPRQCIKEVSERLNYRGEVVRGLDLGEVSKSLRELVELGVESIAVCFLFSFANPVHEREVAQAIKEIYPMAYVSLSSEVNPEFREYERTSTTVANAYIGPKVSSYLTQMEGQVRQFFPASQVLITQSNGGLGTPGMLAKIPVHTVMSGPVAGVMGAKYIARLMGEEKIITIDVGGTSCDMAVVPGQLLTSPETAVGKYVIRAPTVDISTIGTGGGSIARLGPGNVLKVGPQSAGAAPGPACYGRGGEEPTLTDALVVLGWLSPQHLLEGRMPIFKQKAEKAIHEKIAEPLDMDLTQAAAGITRILTYQVAASMRTITIEKGYDPREFVLVAFGGAGPAIAGELVKELNIPKVLIPPDPGNFCAFGMLTTDLVKDRSITRIGIIQGFTVSALNEVFAELEENAFRDMIDQGIARNRINLQRFLDLRYAGQSYEVSIAVGAIQATEDMEQVIDVFNETHGRIYGHKAEGEPIEIVNFRVRAVASIPKPLLKEYPLDIPTAVPTEKDERKAYFADRGYVTAAVYDRSKLVPGNVLNGPVIIEELTSTTVIPPGQVATMDAYRNIIMENAASAN
ncbi:MAG: hydantoinase/oxoprolinase family protein [Chloroflexi bacterium]|nr:hydantoinase/oxoprolinase family protein [Chloroflexota bacterium]